MLMRAARTGASGGAGFPWLGRLVVRHPVMIVAAWLAIAAAMLLLLPTLAKVANKNPPQFLPSDAPVLVAGQAMKDAFHEFDADNMVLVVLSNEKGLGPADEVTYRTVVDRLRADTADVRTTEDFLHTPELRQVMASKDQKAWNLPVSLTGGIGTAEGLQAYRNVAQIVEDTTANTSLSAHFVGAPATFDDVSNIGTRDQHLIEIATVLMVFTILILVYRSVVAMLLPVATIGVSLVVAQQAVAGLGELGLGVGPQTIVLMTGMTMGAGTDYAIFLLSRYHECLRGGLSSDDALETALTSIGKVIAASAGTVAIAFLGMAFTKLAVFSTVGPALAVTIFFAFLASTTLLPALIVLAGRRGWVRPRRDLTGRFWRRSGIHIVRRPRAHLAASLVVLLALAGCATLVKFNFDDRKSLPVDAPSNVAYEAMKRHFPEDPSAQLFVLIQSPRDLRTPKALADLERMAQRVSQLPDIAAVRGVTRPTGEMLEEAKATAQAGEVGTRLQQASTLIADNDANLSQLSGGAHQLADTLGQIRSGVLDAVITIRPLATALADMQRQFGGSKTLDEVDKTARLAANMRSLGEALDANLARLTDVYKWAAPVVAALNVSPQCDADPGCVAGRADLQQVVNAHDGGGLASLSELVRQLRGTQGADTLDQAVRGLGASMDSAISAARSLGLGDPDAIERQLSSLQQGANQLADGSRQLAEGVQMLVDQTRVMGSGLDQASAFLLGMKQDAADPAMSGFYIPPQILTQDEFKQAASIFVSPDGRMVRYLVQTALDPFSTAAMDQIEKIRETVENARPNTALADASVSMVGATGFNYDIRNYYDKDIRYIIVVTLIVVFLILVVLLRAIVAPLYLVLSVILSCMSAVGIGVIFFQFILGQEIAWSLPGTAFLVLVAVGADYNLLLISRVRDESHLGLRSAVIRTVGATGGVITSAGLIFAASMLGLTLSSISTVVQMGFVIGVGLLLDTFLVRTVTVPAMAVLAGKANWWPSKSTAAAKKPPKPRPLLVRAEPSPTSHRLTADADGQQIRVTLPVTITNHQRHLRHHSTAHSLDGPQPPIGTNGLPKPSTIEVRETAPDCHTTGNGKQPIPVVSEIYQVLDPQSTDDFWDQYLTAISKAAGKTNGHRSAETNGHGRVETNGHRPAETNGLVPVVTNGHGPVESNGHLPVETNGHVPVDETEHEPVESSQSARLRHDRSRLVSSARLLTLSAAGVMTFVIGSSSSAEGPQLAAEQTRQNENAPAGYLTPAPAGNYTVVEPSDPVPPATELPAVAPEPPQAPSPPAPQPIASLSLPAEPDVAAPEPMAPLPGERVLAAPKPIAREPLRFAPEPITSLPSPPRNKRRSDTGGSGTGGSGTGGTGTGGTGTDGSGTGGTGTDGSGTGGTGTGGSGTGGTT
jgi:putative drug exporter of the RND superfamily